MTREEAVEVLKERYLTCVGIGLDNHANRVNEAIGMAIEALQTDEVWIIKTGQTHGKSAYIKELAEVVRCKDCRFWKNEHLCLVMSRYGSIDTKADHYCSWGERRKP